MTMGPRLRKVVLTTHLTFSGGWIGAVAAFLVLAVVGVSSQDAHLVRAAYLTMSLLIFHVIVPLALASLLTGIVLSLGTQWGLFRHYWVVTKFLLTSVAIAVLLGQLSPFQRMAEMAADSRSSFISREEALRPLIHAGGSLVVLLVVQVLGIYKPGGMTCYGWRKQHERPTTSRS